MKQVEIIDFPETKVAAIEHLGSPADEYKSIKKLIAWRIDNKISTSDIHRSYGIHYNDPSKVDPSQYRVDLCVSVEHRISENSFGVINKTIPALRCARVRHYGTRENITAAHYLYGQWFPNSDERLADFPVFFHYVNVGPQLQEAEMITDVYLPIL